MENNWTTPTRTTWTIRSTVPSGRTPRRLRGSRTPWRLRRCITLRRVMGCTVEGVLGIKHDDTCLPSCRNTTATVIPAAVTHARQPRGVHHTLRPVDETVDQTLRLTHSANNKPALRFNTKLVAAISSGKVFRGLVGWARFNVPPNTS